MTDEDALNIVRDQMFGLGTREHGFTTRVDAMQHIMERMEVAAIFERVEKKQTKQNDPTS